MTVGERIKKRRIELGYTQEELSKIMGYSVKSTICKAESEGDNITTTKVKKYAKALNCSFEYLMGWEEEKAQNVPEFDPDHLELIDLYSKLTKEQKQTVMNLLRSFVN